MCEPDVPEIQSIGDRGSPLSPGRRDSPASLAAYV
jgi:hypothetical protein